MIVKLTKGCGFRGVLSYGLDGRGTLIGGNMAGRTPRELAHEFGELRRLRPSLGRAVAHYSLSLPPEDRIPDDAEWSAIAERFLRDMGFDSPFVVIRHDDAHPHIHIVASRIKFSGDVVSDQNDYRRHEEIARRIEAEHRFIPVPVSTKKKTTNHRRKIMNEKQIPTAAMPEVHETPAHIATEAFEAFTNADMTSAYAGDQPSERKRREMRRAIRDPGYDHLVASLLGPHNIKHVHHHQRGSVIYTTDGGRLHDNGDQIVAYNTENQLAAERIVALAISRGWTAIVFTGSDDFLRAAFREARKQGMPIHPKGAMQQAILQEILDAELRARGITPASEDMPQAVGAEPPPEATSEQEPLDLASRLKLRRESLATQNPEKNPRAPSVR